MKAHLRKTDDTKTTTACGAALTRLSKAYPEATFAGFSESRCSVCVGIYLERQAGKAGAR